MSALGGDDLSIFLALAREYEQETIAEQPRAFETLLLVHQCFRALAFAQQGLDSPAAVALAMNAHSQFLAAARAGLCGHAAAVFPLIRVCLESGLYCLHVAKHRSAEAKWLGRSFSAAARQQCRDEFRPGNVMNTAEQVDANLGALAREVYDRAIDFGAHPNATGIFKHLEVRENAHGWEISTGYLHGDTSVSREALNACLEVATYALLAISHALPVAAEASGLNARLSRLLTIGYGHGNPPADPPGVA